MNIVLTTVTFVLPDASRTKRRVQVLPSTGDHIYLVSGAFSYPFEVVTVQHTCTLHTHEIHISLAALKPYTCDIVLRGSTEAITYTFFARHLANAEDIANNLFVGRWSQLRVLSWDAFETGGPYAVLSDII